MMKMKKLGRGRRFGYMMLAIKGAKMEILVYEPSGPRQAFTHVVPATNPRIRNLPGSPELALVYLCALSG